MDPQAAPETPRAETWIERYRRDPRLPAAANFLWLFAMCWGLYVLSGSLKWTHYNAHVYLADAFLHGRFHLESPPGHFETTTFEGKTYVAYGIAPTLLMLPFVAVFGLSFHQGIFGAALGALAVAVWWSALGKLGVSESVRTWLTALFGFGSLFWFYAGQSGATWPLMHVVAVLGLMVAIHESLGKQRAWIVGLAFGLAVLSRQTVFLALPLFVVMLWRDDRASGGSAILGKAIGFALGLGSLLGFNAFYNYARFGSLLDNGYARVIADTTAEHSLRHGTFSPHYLEANLQGYFLRLPEKLDHFPWFDPSMDGFSMFIAMPALIFLARADYRQRIHQVALAVIVGIMAFYLFYYWSGYAQFGRRYTVDFLPLAMLLITSGVRNRVGTLLMACVIFGVVVEVWGLFWWGMKGW